MNRLKITNPNETEASQDFLNNLDCNLKLN